MADKNNDPDLILNAMLMLSFFEEADISERDKEQYKSLISSGDATLASVFLLTLMLRMYASETGRSKAELITHLRAVLLEMSN